MHEVDEITRGTECEVLVLGAGLAGLAAASVLGSRAIVLERQARPGGLVQTELFDGYWFDHVIHLLYFPDDDTRRQIEAVAGDVLAPCPPRSWVETQAGTVRFPFQMHLNGIDAQTLLNCLRDLAEVTFGGPSDDPPCNFQQMLAATFGRGMCDTFMFPYNRKMWKRPLAELAPSGFTWNIARPDFDQVLRGALSSESEFAGYNANGFYPRPPADAPLRGMEVLAQRLAEQANDLRVEHHVDEIDLDRRVVATSINGRLDHFRYERACLCTLPLPVTIQICRQAPAELKEACRRLKRNRVISVMLNVRGPRPTGRGHWRYYADEQLIFTRLVYMHEFDPQMAPADGWGLLAEVTERGEDPETEPEVLINRVVRDCEAAGAIPDGCDIIGARQMVVDPAYVVFTPENQATIETSLDFLRSRGVEPLGRYGRWEYSSMGQVMRDGFQWAQAYIDHPKPSQPESVSSPTVRSYD